MGAILRTLCRLITVLFLAGNTLLLILIILSGSLTQYPINRFYWIQADTSNIPNAPSTTRWTFWGACSIENGITTCGEHLAPATPISPMDNFDTTINVPAKFIDHRDHFYYLSRFSFCFFWIALAFIGVAFLLYFIAVCSKKIFQVVLILSIVGSIFNIIAVVLQTAVSVLARNAFHDADLSAKISAPLLGIAWASAVVSFCNTFFAGYWWYLARKGNNNDYSNEKGFFHRNNDVLNVPEPIDPYPIPQPINIDEPIANNNEDASAQVIDKEYEINSLQEKIDKLESTPALATSQPVIMNKNTSTLSVPVAENASNNLTNTSGVNTPTNGETNQKGIKFFTVRRNQQNNGADDEDEDEVSI